MNMNLYNQLVDFFSFMTIPLWELYSSYNVISGPPFLGVALLGIRASVYPSQIIGALVFAVYITNQVVYKKDWWKMAGALFLGCTFSVYSMLMMMHAVSYPWSVVFINGSRSLVSLFLILISFAFFLPLIFPNKKWTGKLRKLPLSLINGFLISFVISLSIGPETVDIFPMLLYSAEQSFISSLFVSMVFAFSSFVFVWMFSILSYGYKLDVFLSEKLVDRRIEWYFGLVTFTLAINHILIYW